MLKRALGLGLALVLLCLTASCGKKEESQAPASSVSPQASSAPAESEALSPLPLAGMLNPLTGREAIEGALEGQRPVAVMVANNRDSYPQRGLAAADVVVESLTEGGITRLMAMYGDFRCVPQVGPVRSTRDQFVQLAVPSNAILTHIGSSIYAENLLNVLSYQDIDGIYLGTTAFTYDAGRSTLVSGKLNENCWFTDTNMIWAGMNAIDLSVLGEVHMMFQFAPAELPKAESAYYAEVWYSGSSACSFHYQEDSGRYAKTAYGELHKDEDGSLLQFKNLFFLNCEVTMKPDGVVPEYNLSGGTGLYLVNGSVQEITWTKGGPTDALRLFAADGTELQVEQGKSYIGLVPNGVKTAPFYRSKAEQEQVVAEAAAAASQPA